MSIAAAYFFRGDHPKALEYDQRALQFNPSNSYGFFWQGLVEVHIGEYQKG